MTFIVTLQPSGRRFAVHPDETLLAAALRQDIHLPRGCTRGVCGICLARILSGSVHYEKTPQALNEMADDSGLILPCSARPLSDLVLELREVGSGETLAEGVPTRVTAVDSLAEGVLCIVLQPPKAQPLTYAAGQYIDVHCADGLKRSFSIAAAPRSDGALVLHVRIVPATPASLWQVGDVLRVEGPFGGMRLDADSPRPKLLLAGGSGVAPFVALLEQAFADGLAQELWLYWGVRRKEDLYLVPQLQAWEAAHANFHFVPVLSEAPADWTGHKGWAFAAAIDDLGGAVVNHEVCVSGPPEMVQSAYAALLAAGLSPVDFRSDIPPTG